jgi:hypothetical protein
VRKVADVDVFERPSFAPSEMLVTRQCCPLHRRYRGVFVVGMG